MTPSYELFDHTADVGVRATAATPGELVPVAVAGLYATIGQLRPASDRANGRLAFTGTDRAGLLRDLLAEFLFVFETEQRIGAAISVIDFTAETLVVDIDWARVHLPTSELAREAKAVTYHDLRCAPSGDGWIAEFIVDI